MRSRPRGAPAKVIGCARQMGKAKSGEILRFEPQWILLDEGCGLRGESRTHCRQAEIMRLRSRR
jgi:hypothetical protein